MEATVEVIEVIERPAITVLSRRTLVELAGIGQAIGEAFGDAYAQLGRQGVAPAGPPFVVYHGIPGAGPLEIEVCAPVPGPVVAPPGWQVRTLPAARVAVMTHQGPYDSVGAAYDAMWAWLPAHALEPAGPPREVYLSPPETPPSLVRTVIEVPVRAVAAT